MEITKKTWLITLVGVILAFVLSRLTRMFIPIPGPSIIEFVSDGLAIVSAILLVVLVIETILLVIKKIKKK